MLVLDEYANFGYFPRGKKGIKVIYTIDRMDLILIFMNSLDSLNPQIQCKFSLSNRASIWHVRINRIVYAVRVLTNVRTKQNKNIENINSHIENHVFLLNSVSTQHNFILL